MSKADKIAELVPFGYNLLVSRRTNGTFGVTLQVANPRKRKGPGLSAEGVTFEDALLELEHKRTYCEI